MQTQLTFLSLQSRDRPALAEFFQATLGFTIADQPNPAATVFADDGGAIFAVRDPQGDLPEGPLGLGVAPWFGVRGPLSEYLERVVSGGGRIVKTPFPPPFGPACVFATPVDHYSITLYQVDHRG